MSWGNPYILFALVVPLLVAMRLRRAREREPRNWWPAITRVSIVGSRMHPARATARPRPWLLLLALTFAIIGLARPRWGEPRNFGFQESREVLIALDLSRSMLVTDVDPTRLERSHQLAGELLDKLQGERVGLIVFAGTAFVQVPLSSDYQIIREFLPILNPDYMPRGGTDYTGMLKAALDGFSRDADTDRFLVVISDGGSTTEGWREQLVQVAKRGVRIISLAVGTEAGGVVPGKNVEEDDAHKKPDIISKLQPATIQALAASTGGVFRKANDKVDIAALLAETVAAGRKGRFAAQLGASRPERFQWFLAPAVILGMIGLWREVGLRPRARHVRRQTALHTADSSVATAVAVILAVAILFQARAFAHNDGSDEAISFRASVDSTAADRLLKIVEHLARRGYDASDVRLMVEETIAYGLEAQTKKMPVAVGAIQDAINATRYGERLDPKIANWSYLRAQLDRLIVPDISKSEKPPTTQDTKEALDEEDKPPETAGQSTQQTTSESGGKGGPSKSDASLGDLQDEPIRSNERPSVPPSNMRGSRSASAPAAPRKLNDPVHALTLKNWKEAISQDSPGFLHQAIQGSTETKPEGDEDY